MCQSVRMVLEVGLIDVTAGQEDAFVAAYRQARSILAETEGAISVRMTGGVEQPTRFVLMVEWESIAAHVDNFRSTDRFTAWRAALGPFFASPPVVNHFVDVD